MRLDQYLFDNKLAPSRSKAKEFIESSLVRVNGKLVTKPSHKISEGDEVELEDSDLGHFVSRAALKLKGAIEKTGIDLRGLNCLDIGVSTGGFSQFLLESEARQVIGVDVGSGQTHDLVAKHPQFLLFENTNAKDINKIEELSMMLSEMDLIVMDVSFISITKILPSLLKGIKKEVKLLSLVKPQFELEKSDLNKQGIVKAEASYQRVENKIKSCLAELNGEVLDYFPSSIQGGDGNKEFFVYAKLSNS